VLEFKTSARYPARSQGLARVELQIRDDGVGLTAEGQARLYEAFYTTKRDGHGLGHAAVRTILDQQNATIQCDSTPGVGTTFLVSFPVESTD
jgi:signal transduction histidine kinase